MIGAASRHASAIVTTTTTAKGLIILRPPPPPPGVGVGGGGGERVDCDLCPHVRLPFDPRETHELDEVLISTVLHDEMSKEGMMTAEDRHAGSCPPPDDDTMSKKHNRRYINV